MNCDPITGYCEIPKDFEHNNIDRKEKPIKLLYFTDPICSSCWGIDPQLRKLKQEYGHYFDIEYRMGGLLKSWKEYGGSDVSGPSSVAQHWQEASHYYQMPIDGKVWLNDPLDSSYPPSIAFKAAQMQDKQKAEQFLRRIKEMVFTEQKNISKLEHLVQAAKDSGLDHIQFKYDFRNTAKILFEDDLRMAKDWGVRGFPTIYFIDADDNRFKVYGSKPYEVYESALLRLINQPLEKQASISYIDIFKFYSTVTLKEFEVFYNLNTQEAMATLANLVENKKLIKIEIGNGFIWKEVNL
ncbi:DsbA family protein [Sediminibacterium sp. TEGAF015]|uniref:DsbA family protein n=1 Tax=Sediminibacterium sp. TEGAF015 TaxID=575378 RepID=UPI00220CBB05|nr:DsbA family protein [Sediminibacterium sp. TEGAF015]BDQ13202.1 hypothetical protein TEGAF0_24190 [Sediminibacterium sp. TEGAF015]